MATRNESAIRLFLKDLDGYVKREDRGALADLRHGFSAATAYRAWPYVARHGCRLDSSRDRAVWTTVAAGAATQEGSAACGNMGETLRHIALEGRVGSERDALVTYDARFRRLLTCAEAEDVCAQLGGILRTAARKRAPVNYERLFWDLVKWGDDVKVAWASRYWGEQERQQEGGATA